MRNKVNVKKKKSLSKKEKKNIILSILFSIISLVVGFFISFFGQGESYVETELITAIITLFGFGLTATVFVCQSFEDSQTENTMKVIKALSKTLFLTLVLVVCSLIFDFIASVITSEVWLGIMESAKYAALVYSTICQFDVLNSFIVIIRSGKKEENKKNE